MPQSPWSWNTIGCRPDCCERDNNCRYYFPCCLRDMTVEISALSEATSDGESKTVTVSRMTLTNHCNGQEGIDWSTFNVFGGIFGPPDNSTSFSGHEGQGCTFGVDVETEHLFCECEGQDQNFTVKITICNHHDEEVYVNLRDPSMAIRFGGFSADPSCALEFKGISPDPAEATLAAGEEKIFEVYFGTANVNCFNHCYTSDFGFALVERGEAGFIEVLREGGGEGLFETTCLERLACFSDAPNTIIPDGWEEINDCDDSLCPPCGCILDYGRVDPCACACEGIPPLNACENPKQSCSGCTEAGGSITICHDSNHGHGPALETALVECRDASCQLTMEIVPPSSGGSTWTYRRYGNPGASATVAVSSLPNSCESYVIEWGLDGGDLFIEVDGQRGTQTPPGGYDPDTGGTCYVLGKNGTVFSYAAGAPAPPGGETLDAEPGEFIINGIAAGLLYLMIKADPGEFLITGSDAILAQSIPDLTADPGSLLLTGTDAELVKISVLMADPGSINIAGVNAELIKDSILSANPGSVLIAGTDAELVKISVLMADPGSVIMTGTSAEMIADRILNVDPGSIIVSGQDATFVYEYLDLDTLTIDELDNLKIAPLDWLEVEQTDI